MKNCCKCCIWILNRKQVQELAKTENKDYVQIYKRILNYHRQYTSMKGSDQEWEQCCSDGDAIAKSFGNGRFVRDLVIAVQNEISRKIGGHKDEAQNNMELNSQVHRIGNVN